LEEIMNKIFPPRDLLKKVNEWSDKKISKLFTVKVSNLFKKGGKER